MAKQSQKNPYIDSLLRSKKSPLNSIFSTVKTNPPNDKIKKMVDCWTRY